MAYINVLPLCFAIATGICATYKSSFAVLLLKMSRYQKAQARSRLVQIKDVLRENPRGLTISEISRKIDVNRNSVAKYLDVLLISGQVEMRVLGPAKLFYLSQRVPISAMLNFSSDYILALENNLKIVQVNDNLLKLLNIKREAILGLGIEGFPHPIFTSQEIISKIDEAFEGKDSTVEGRSQVSGKEFYFNMKLIPSTFEDGSPGVTLCMEDITKRKEAEWALRERVKELGCLFGISRLVEGSDRDLESILEKVVSLIPPAWQYPDITCARIVFDEQIFESDNFKETDWKQSVDIEVHGEKVGAVEVYYLEDMPESYEGPFLKEERDLIDAIAERLGRIIERIQFEEMLRASEAMYSALVENTTDGIVIIQDDVLKFINTASVELVGYTPEELMGLEFINLVAPEHRETVMKRYSDRLEGIDVPSIYETSLLRKDGTTLPVEVNAALIDYEGRPADLVFIRDITERKKMEKTC